MKKVLLSAIFILATGTAMAQTAANPSTPVPVHNAACLADTCLTGASAAVINIIGLLVIIATALSTYIFKDKTTSIGKIIDRIANLKVTK